MTTPNPWAGFLEDDETGRQAAYQSYRPQWGQGRQAGYYENQFGQMYNQYLGTLGAQVRQGQEPTGQFNDYLGGYDWAGGYRQNVPYGQRTQGQNAFNPQVQWVVPGMGRGRQ